MNKELSRRQFLQQFLPASGTAVLFLAGCRLQAETQVSPTAPPATAVATPPTTLPPLNRDLILTPNDEFYVMETNGTPTVNRAEWQLTIDGLVENPLTLNFADIEARPFIEQMRTLECIGNAVGGNQIGNAVWGGILLADLLEEVGVLETAVRAKFEAADNYETSVTLDWINQPGTMLAYQMNGEPLPPEHGYPLRLFMPGLYGQKMPKWITRIQFIDDDGHLGTWEKQGWSNVAQVKTNSQIMMPTHIQKLPLASLEIFGVAYAGGRPIAQVEVGIEQQDGALRWQPAEALVRGPSNEVWTQFYLPWTPPAAGTYTLFVRATDETGFVQTERARGVLEGAFPDGTDKIHNIVIVVE
jgi:DMSO/TMAO reductase YedYZ molybdopterin-dependent catalytic subunit